MADNTLSIYTTPTTTLSKLRGFTLNVLKFLEADHLTSWQVAVLADKTTTYVNVYLFRLQKYGLALKNEDFWFLTKEGVQFSKLVKLSNNNNNNNNRTITQQQHNNNRILTDKQPKTLKQISIESWLHVSDMRELEKEVVEVLVKHYNETGIKFKLFEDIYEASNFFKAKPDELNRAMMHLKQDGIAYPWKDHTFGAWKVALYKAFVEGLANQSELK